MKNSTNSSDSSRGSAPKIGRHTARATSMNGRPSALRRSQVSSDSLSSCAAPRASHGASTGTFSASEFRRGIASSRSGSSGDVGRRAAGRAGVGVQRAPAAGEVDVPAGVEARERRDPELVDERADVVLRRPDELRAEVDDLTAGHGAVEHPPADAIARLDDRHRVPGAGDLARRDEAGEPGADDDDIVLAARARTAGGPPLRRRCCQGPVAGRGGGRGRSGRGRTRDEAAAADASGVLAHACTITRPAAPVKRPRSPGGARNRA